MKEQRMCLLEKVLLSSGFVLVHDGQHNPGQIELPPGEIAFYTRKYRWKVDGEFVDTWATFKYDQRSQFADFEIYSREGRQRGRERMVFGVPEEKHG